MPGRVRAIDTPECVAVERIVDQITTFGTVELEFCFCGRLGVLGAYVPHLSGNSPRFAYWSPRDPVLRTACGRYLRQRSRELLTETELAAWAVKHHWPNPERFEPGAVAESVGRTPATEAAVLDALSEGGKYDPRTAFLFNLNTVVWDPIQGEFGFPDIPDHLTANACREYLRGAGLALHDPQEKQLRRGSDPFTLLIQYATRREWPRLEALIGRAAQWQVFRSSIGAMRLEEGART